jgi:Phage P22-like portal protein
MSSAAGCFRPLEKKQEKLLTTARERFVLADEAERENRLEARTDLRFIAGDQWNRDVKTARDRAKRPSLVINKLPVFVSQETNEARQNKPAIKISPVDSGIDVDTADVVQGLVRHIEYDSDADVAYVTAVEYAISCGFGYFRILTDYCNENSFDQEIKIVPVYDPFSVYFDPSAKKADRSDARWAFVRERISKDEFKQRWPESETVTSNFFDGTFDEGDWIEDDTVAIAEYWYIEYERKTLCALADGRTAFEDEVPQGANIIKRREVQTRTVKCATINGAEILEEYEWPGQWIPIVPVFGRELMVEGRRHLFSLIRFQRDPQQILNYYKTAMAETVQMAPRTPYVGYEGQFKGHERQWQSANVTNYAYLEVKPMTVNGTVAPLPQRNVYEPPVQALSLGALQASDDMKATAGIFDAALGAQSRETSGLAIGRRQQESNTANYHFQDNLVRAQRFAGRIIVDLIPKIYDTGREVRILGEDREQKVVTVNQHYIDETSKVRHYNLSMGKYDVTVSTGPSYQSQRQAAFDMLTELGRNNPQVLQLGGDIIFRNSDIPGADELAERWKKTLPPGLVDDENQPQVPPAIAQQMHMMGQQHDQLVAAVKQLTQERDSKILELQSKEKIAKWGIERDLAIGLAKINAADAQQKADFQWSQLEQVSDQVHEARMAGLEHAHAAHISNQGNIHAINQQASQQRFQAGQQASQQDFQAQQAEQAAQLPEAA